MRSNYTYRKARRSLRQPALRLLLLLLLVLDAITVLNIASSQKQAGLHSPPRNTRRIYIAAQHWNTEYLLRDRWNKCLLDLVQELGKTNVYVTIFESGSWDDTKGALRELDAGLEALRIPRNISMSNISHKDEISQQPVGHGWIKTPAGETKLRRIPFLANLRNRVLDPLRRLEAQGEHFDTVLFLNDVVFSVKDVLTLLDTNNGEYAAACSMDFQKYPRYYDTFALRDSHGHETVSQTWPYFRSRASRHAMQHFAPVPVASCWNGMVAMPVDPFLGQAQIGFRGTPDSLAASHVEGSECCLIHADNPLSSTLGVYVNPSVRVGYDGFAYDAAQAHAGKMGYFGIWTAVWKNRILRWFSTVAIKEAVVHKRVKKWMDKTGGREPGEFCLVNEMQVIMENGWKHV